MVALEEGNDWHGLLFRHEHVHGPRAVAARRPHSGTGSTFTEDFMTAATPGIVSTTMLLAPNNPAYKNDAEYVMGIANELKKEYEYIVSEGYILQLDAPISPWSASSCSATNR